MHFEAVLETGRGGARRGRARNKGKGARRGERVKEKKVDNKAV